MKFSAIIFVTTMLSVVHANSHEVTTNDADPTKSITDDDWDPTFFADVFARGLVESANKTNTHNFKFCGSESDVCNGFSNAEIDSFCDKFSDVYASNGGDTQGCISTQGNCTAGCGVPGRRFLLAEEDFASEISIIITYVATGESVDPDDLENDAGFNDVINLIQDATSSIVTETTIEDSTPTPTPSKNTKSKKSKEAKSKKPKSKKSAKAPKQ